MNAAEDDDLGFGALGLLSEGEAVADKVGECLYFVALIVVAKDDGVFFFFQSQYFLLQFLVVHSYKI